MSDSLARAAGNPATTTVDDLLAAVSRAREGREGDLAAVFARTALQRVPPGLLASADEDTLVSWLLDAWDFLVADEAGDTGLRLRVRTPDIGPDGRSGAGTVVEVAGLDRPFIVSTLTATLDDLGHAIVRTLYPIVGVIRDERGRVTDLVSARDASEPRTIVQVQLDGRLDDDELTTLRGRLRTALDDVVRATDDHELMTEQVLELADHLEADLPAHGDDDPAEVAAFLRWLVDGHLVLLGWRAYAVDQDADPVTVSVVPGSGLGILADTATSQFAEPVPMSALDDEHQRRFAEARLLRVSRTNRSSTVHRAARMDYVGVIEVDGDGRPVVEHRLLGLFTAAAFAAPTATVPVLRRRLDVVRRELDVVPGSHDDTLFTALFQALPTDELFQSDTAELRDTLIALAEAEEHHRIRVVTRVEPFTSTVSVILAVPRDDWSPSLRRDVQQLLADTYDAVHVTVDLALGDRAEAVARFAVEVAHGIPDVDTHALEQQIRRRARSWEDRAREHLVDRFGEAEGHRLTRSWARRFPTAFRETTAMTAVAEDVARLDGHRWEDGHTAVWLRRDEGLHLLVAKGGGPLVLSDLLPVVESLGLRVLSQVPHELVGDGNAVTIHDLVVTASTPDVAIDPEADGERIAATILASRDGRTDVDDLHHLVASAGLTWQEVAVLRAYRRYRRQAGTAYATETLNEALIANPTSARALVRVFRHRFDPDLADRDEAGAREAVLASCDDISRLDHDRIVRDVLALVDATLRTNAFRPDRVAENAAGVAVPYLAFKLDSHAVPGLPDPVPYREIFVHSPEVEGIHLRGGRVARGGLRWSDRRDDTRTEVLGLMQAQMLKNAVIVPEGAKGGFVLGRPPADPLELRHDVRHQYTTFIRALLDVTDTVDGDTIVPPTRVLRHDEDDPYLVVAADKGTATFSDVANGIAIDRGFWLGDAFASGGSVGYDHKRLGITARGAWVATTRHFAELGVDLQQDPVTVVGVGDMSGDVFGNGMLLSQSLRLLAAFDHRDVFLDPDPDPAVSHAERQRLFDLPSSSWQDYDRDLLSEGGMIVSRSAKEVEVTPRVAEVLGIDDLVITTADLVRHILRARVDLLYFGGIGTYVKAEDESDAAIGDRANDEVRVLANEVRARVVTEGANLAVTQPGRISYARRGGRIDQDAVHNAAGVDISDHEVNLKILLDLAVGDGRITRDERADWLRRVTDDVVAHVLGDVDRQCARLSRDAADAAQRLDAWARTVRRLEATGDIDRVVHHLPDDAEFRRRAQAGAGLTRPEIATVLASAKRQLTRVALEAGLTSQPGFADTLRGYFPAAMLEAFGDLLPRHRLHDELVATLAANTVVDRLGPTFVFELAGETNHDPADVLAAVWAARLVVDADRWWRAIRRTEGWLAPDRVETLLTPLDALLEGLTRTYLDDPAIGDVADLAARDRAAFDVLRGAMPELGAARQRRRRDDMSRTFADDLVDDDLAMLAASAEELVMVADVAAMARRAGRSDDEVLVHLAAAMLRVDDRLQLGDLRQAVRATAPDGRWQVRQQSGLLADVDRLRRDAVATATTQYPDQPAEAAVDARFPLDHRRVQTVTDVIRDVLANQPDPAALAVAVRATQDLLRPI